MRFPTPAIVVAGLFAAALPLARTSAQIGGLVRNAVNSAAQTKIDNMVNCAVNDQGCIDKAHADGKKVTVVDAKGKPLKDQSAANAAPKDTTASSVAESNDPPGTGVWLNYDFVPGERTIWWEDFSGDEVGDFPHRMSLENGNLEVVNIKGTKYLRTEDGGTVKITLPETLPARFTVEVSYFAPASTNSLVFRSGDGGAEWGCNHDGAWIRAADGVNSGVNGDPVPETAFVNCRFTIDTRYVKAYFNEKRTGNVPNAAVTRGNTLELQIPGFGKSATLVTAIRVAAGGKKLYDALAASGRVATQGILFDVSSDHIRGESTPTLKEIAEMLQAHPDLKLTIEGHTDNTGSAAGNQTLSEKRAAAVRQYLIDTYHVDGGRLQSAGFGATKPVSSNDTPEGRQNNRRVELVRN